MKTSPILVRPLNPDNDVEVNQLIALFERGGADAALSDAVRSPRFWKSASGRRFTALLAISEGRVIAHCGLGTLARFTQEQGAPGSAVATLSYLMIDPSAANQVAEIASQIRAIVHSQLPRKGIRSLLAVHLSTRDGVAALLRELGLTPVAAFEDASRFLQIYARSFESSSRTVGYLPAQLREVVSATFEQLRIPTIKMPTTATDLTELTDAVPVDERSVQTLPFSKARRALLLLTPSLLQRGNGGTLSVNSIEQLLEGRSAALIGIKMADRGCTDLVRIVQSLGYEYCGILPALFGRDSVLFAKQDSRAATTRSARVQPHHAA